MKISTKTKAVWGVFLCLTFSLACVADSSGQAPKPGEGYLDVTPRQGYLDRGTGKDSPYPITQGKDGRYYYYSPNYNQWNPIAGTTKTNPDGSTTTDRRQYGTPTKYVPQPDQSPQQFFSGQHGKRHGGRGAPGDSRTGRNFNSGVGDTEPQVPDNH